MRPLVGELKIGFALVSFGSVRAESQRMKWRTGMIPRLPASVQPWRLFSSRSNAPASGVVRSVPLPSTGQDPAEALPAPHAALRSAASWAPVNALILMSAIHSPRDHDGRLSIGV